MARKDPAFLLFYESFLHGTQFMTDAAAGAYIRILCWQADIGPMTYGQMKSRCKDMETVWFEIREKFVIVDDSVPEDEKRYFNKRLAEEKEKRSIYCKSRSHPKKIPVHTETICKPYGNRTRNTNQDQIQDQIQDVGMGEKVLREKKEEVERPF